MITTATVFAFLQRRPLQGEGQAACHVVAGEGNASAPALPGVEDQESLFSGQRAGRLLGLLGKATSAPGLLQARQVWRRLGSLVSLFGGWIRLVSGRVRPGRNSGATRNRARLTCPRTSTYLI